MPSYIGVVDAQIGPKQVVNHQTNKIGGAPDWPVGDVGLLSLLQCSECSQTLALVVQLYCPLEGSSFHRTLYVFACITPACWNKQHSWVAVRCQVLDAQCSQAKAEPATTTPVVADDDWGTSGADDWGVESDDWGEAGGSSDTGWGETGGSDTGLGGAGGGDDGSKGDIGGKDDKTGMEGMVEEDTHGSLQETQNDGPDLEAELNTTDSADPSDDLNLQQMCLDDVADDDDDDNNGIADPGSHILAEDLPTTGGEEKRVETLKALVAESRRPHDGDRVLVPFYIDVFEEPARQLENDDRHVTELLRQYQRQEGGLDIEENVSGGKGSKGAKGGGGGEKYEKTSVVHSDAVFYKFMKRLSVCPEQCIRYEWGGSPLYIRRPQNSGNAPVSCQHCGGTTVYEAQLMPALVNSLKFPDHQGAALEFGTVILFTCQRSCWSEGNTYRTERLIVQADPDQEKFKV